MVLSEVEFALSFDSDHGQITKDHLTNPSLNCPTGGSRAFSVSTDLVFSDSSGDITASVLVDRAQQWISGVRVANGVSFQLSPQVW